MRRDAYPTLVPRAYPVGRLAASSRHPFAGKRLPTVVYAWDDLRVLVGAEAE